MEKKLNIAELLKDCPKGMELDCTIFSGLEFDRIDENNGSYPIICRTKTTNGKYHVHTFTKHGCYSTEMYSKCVIYPKDETTWEGFVPPCKFKVGDNIRIKGTSAIYVVTEIREDRYMLDDKDILLRFINQDQWELVPNKFDITTLKPFDKVLVKDNSSGRWDITFYELYDDTNQFYPHRILGGNAYRYCIPYEGNEHLLGKTDDCDEYYKTWA